jgi:hypothetical protein
MNGPVYVGLAVGSLNEPQREADAVFGSLAGRLDRKTLPAAAPQMP